MSRDIDVKTRDWTGAVIRRDVVEISERRQIPFLLVMLNSDPPAAMADVVQEAIGDACGGLGLASLPMISRAYHDSLFMARIAPTGMIFIPCKDGISHRPEEFGAPRRSHAGSRSWRMTLARLSGTAGTLMGSASGRAGGSR